MNLRNRIERLEGFSGGSGPDRVQMVFDFPDINTLEEYSEAVAIIDAEYLRWKSFMSEGRPYTNTESLERIKDQILKQRSEARL